MKWKKSIFVLCAICALGACAYYADSNEQNEALDRKKAQQEHFVAGCDFIAKIGVGFHQLLSEQEQKNFDAGKYTTSQVPSISELSNALWYTYEHDGVKIEYTKSKYKLQQSNSITIWSVSFEGHKLPKEMRFRQYYVSQLKLSAEQKLSNRFEAICDADSAVIEFKQNEVSKLKFDFTGSI